MRKTQCIQSNRFYSLCALQFLAFFLCACVALCTTVWKPTFESVFCTLTAATLFQHLTRIGLRQPAIGTFLFHDGWAACEIWWSMLVRDIIIKASTLNKWTPVSASACVTSGRADLLQVCQIINSVTEPVPLLSATHSVYCSPSMKEEQAKATCMTGAFHTHPPCAVWRSSYVHRSPCKCRVCLATEWYELWRWIVVSGSTQIKGRRRRHCAR